MASERDPGGTSKTYDYTPAGARLSQDTAGGPGPAGYGYYSCNGHSDVEAVTGSSGTTTATYGYTACGSPVTSMFTGADKNDATSSSSSTTQPYSACRFNAMRWDSATGSYDMGFRNYDPGINQFASRDMYNGATQDMGLTTDPFTGGAYAFGGGNPVSNIESDGHSFLAPGGGGGGTGITQAQANAMDQALLSSIVPAINAGAKAAEARKTDNASNAANKLALETIGIPLVDVGTGLDAAFFQAWKGVNAIQNGNTTGGAGDLAGSALSLFGGKILSKLGGSLAGKVSSTVSNIAGDAGGSGVGRFIGKLFGKSGDAAPSLNATDQRSGESQSRQRSRS